MANSRVGEMIMTPTPLRGINFNLYINSTAGIRNANVLPLPVLAEPTKSLLNQENHEKFKMTKSNHLLSLQQMWNGFRLNFSHMCESHFINGIQCFFRNFIGQIFEC